MKFKNKAKSQRLIRLPNGSWVNPETVRAIIPLPTRKGHTGQLLRAEVAVHHGAIIPELIMANDDEHAITIAHEIASQVNQ